MQYMDCSDPLAPPSLFLQSGAEESSATAQTVSRSWHRTSEAALQEKERREPHKKRPLPC